MEQKTIEANLSSEKIQYVTAGDLKIISTAYRPGSLKVTDMGKRQRFLVQEWADRRDDAIRAREEFEKINNLSLLVSFSLQDVINLAIDACKAEAEMKQTGITTGEALMLVLQEVAQRKEA